MLVSSSMLNIVKTGNVGEFGHVKYCYLEGEFGHVVHGDRDDDDAEGSDDKTGAVNRLVDAFDERGIRVDGVKTENCHRERDYKVKSFQGQGHPVRMSYHN